MIELAALPAEREAAAPPEARGLARDEVRLLVADGDIPTHARFRELPQFLRPGDLLVVNNSGARNAAVDARLGDQPVVLHFSTWLDDGRWVVEVRSPDGTPGPVHTRGRLLVTGSGIAGATVELEQPWMPEANRLWIASVDVDVPELLRSTGRPITYSYVRQRWSPEYYRTVFQTQLGSAEMPSAARPFTERIVTRLVSRGIAVAPVTLHTGVSSPEFGEPPSPERFTVPAATWSAVAATRQAGGRVIAVGTTVTRALESVGEHSGWTNLVLGPQRPASVVDGLITGWHAPGASHLDLLEAVAGAERVRSAYAAARAGDYLWHEFGDSALLFRDPDQRGPTMSSTVRAAASSREPSGVVGSMPVSSATRRRR